MQDSQYVRLAMDSEGWYRSRLFPGLWLHPETLLHGFPTAIHTMMHEGMKGAEHAAFAQQLAASMPPPNATT